MGFDWEMGRLFSIIFALLLCAGCSGEKKLSPPKRIASLCTAGSAVLCSLGIPPAAVDHYSVPVVPEGTAVIGKGSAVSAEKIVELGIDTLVVWSYQMPAVEHLERFGIRVIALDPVRLKSFPGMVEKLGRLTGKEGEARQLAEKYEKLLLFPESAPKKPKRVYLELYTSNRGAGELSYAGDLLKAAGGRSILEKSALTGSEHIITKDPEVIFFVEGFTTAEEIMKRQGFSVIEAVKRKAVFPVPRRLLVEGAFPVEAVEYFKKRMN